MYGFNDYIDKTLLNQRGYMWGRNWETKYGIEQGNNHHYIELYHYGTLILRANIGYVNYSGEFERYTHSDVVYHGGWSQSDSSAKGSLIRKLNCSGYFDNGKYIVDLKVWTKGDIKMDNFDFRESYKEAIKHINSMFKTKGLRRFPFKKFEELCRNLENRIIVDAI